MTKIQSGFRGMQARKQVREMKPEEKPAENNGEEELPDLNSFDNNEVEAITKIQSGFRGMQARKQVREMKPEEKPAENNEEEELPPSTANSVAVSQAMFSPRNEPLPETAREN